MNLHDVVAALEGNWITQDSDLDLSVEYVCAADLMSDVLAFAVPGCVLVTGLCNPQVVCTAEMADIAGIVFVRGKAPPPETVVLAKEEQIPLAVTQHSMFETCGRLHSMGLKGVPTSL